MYEYFAHPYVCAEHACNAHGIQKKASDPMELELQMPKLWKLGTEPGYSARALATTFLRGEKLFSPERCSDS